MPESDRLQLLRQQRKLMQEQLALLDRQITLEAGSPPPTLPAPTGMPPPVSLPPPSAAAETDADALLAKFAATEEKHGVSKFGCWLGLVIVLLLLGVIIGGVLYFFYR